MTPFTVHRGVAAPILRVNVDTDAIIPSREMKTVTKRGLSGGLFAGWRYLMPGTREPNPDFVLNQPGYAGASILLSGANFGCGSSREHAVWALAEYGIRCIIAPSFGTIFHNNCLRNGLLPVQLDDASIVRLATQIRPDPQSRSLTIDLIRGVLFLPGSDEQAFEVAPAHRRMLLEGLDPIGLTLEHADAIAAHIERDATARPWAKPPIIP